MAALEDKVLQKAMAQTILMPVYEPEFLGFSYGFRPGRGAHDALDALTLGIERRKVNWIVDADVRSYFDMIPRDVLIAFLEQRIGDRRVIRLIRKWLNAGVIADGTLTDTGRGTPQGGTIGPCLAKVFLHHVLDLWFHRQWRPNIPNGDDFVVGFQYKRDAERFLCDLKDRLAADSLELHPGKTRLIEFGRSALADRRARGERRAETFDFLGFTHDCRTTRKGQLGLYRKPMTKRVNRVLAHIKTALHRRMHHDIHETARWLGRVLNGWLRYYAVPTSFSYLKMFVHCLEKLWLRILRRRSQKDRTTWDRFKRLAEAHWPQLRILHPWPTRRFAVNHPR